MHEEYELIDEAFESIFIEALEGHTIDPKEREKLSDDCFAIVTTDENGDKKRSYPLRVPGDKKKTAELISKAIAMFHYCKGHQKKQLAEAILRAIEQEQVKVTISRRNQILRYVDEEDFPNCVTFTSPTK